MKLAYKNMEIYPIFYSKVQGNVKIKNIFFTQEAINHKIKMLNTLLEITFVKSADDL